MNSFFFPVTHPKQIPKILFNRQLCFSLPNNQLIEILFVAMRRLITLTLTLTLILFFSAHLFAQGTIYGIVVDSLTQEPLPMATVYVNGTTQGTATDNDGRFELGTCRSLLLLCSVMWDISLRPWI